MTQPSPLPYGRQDINDDDVQAVVKALAHPWLTQGPAVRDFEDGLAAQLGVKHVIAVSSGTAALHLACAALEMGPGDLGITSAITFVASANCIRYVGGDVRFTDADPETGLMDIGHLDRLVRIAEDEGNPPKVIIPVDLTGQPVDLPRIQAIAKRCGAAVIEDAAHSLGGTYLYEGTHFKAAGCAHADMAILSFHPIKHITTAEGGAITTNSDVYAERLRLLRSHGIHKKTDTFNMSPEDPYFGPWYYEQDTLGFNYRIPDVLCALGSSQLKRLDAFVLRRQAIAARYNNAFATRALAPFFAGLKVHLGRTNAHHLYVVQLKAQILEDGAGKASQETLPQVALRRRDLYHFLRANQIFAQVNYIPVPWQPYYQRHSQTSREDFPGAESYYARSLSLPMYPAMTDEDVDRVIQVFQAWVEQSSAPKGSTA